MENECKQKLGTGSNMICSFHSSINRCDKSTPFPPEPTTTTDQSTITNDYRSPNQGSESEHTAPTTAQPSHHFTQRKTAKHQDLLFSVIISVALISALLIIIFAVFFVHSQGKTNRQFLVVQFQY